MRRHGSGLACAPVLACALLLVLAGCGGGATTPSTPGPSPTPTAEGTVATPAWPSALSNASVVRYVERRRETRAHNDAVADGAYRVSGGCEATLDARTDAAWYVYVECGIATYYRDGSHRDGFVRAAYRVTDDGLSPIGLDPVTRLEAGGEGRSTQVTVYNFGENASASLAWMREDGTVVWNGSGVLPPHGRLAVYGLPSPTAVPTHRLRLSTRGRRATTTVRATTSAVRVYVTPDGDLLFSTDDA